MQSHYNLDFATARRLQGGRPWRPATVVGDREREVMLKQRFEFAAAAPWGDRASDLRCGALVGRTLYQAAAVLAQLARGPAATALNAEAELLAVTDLDAAVQALGALGEAQAALQQALSDVRIGQAISAAIIRAADALPDDISEAAA
jgi:hypothetical protein